jgi:excinuclease ABC subunit B
MKTAAADLEFEEAARLRDEIRRLEAMELEMPTGLAERGAGYNGAPQPARPRSKGGAAHSSRGRARRPQWRR